MSDMKKAQTEVSSILNDFGFNEKEFCKHMSNDHRTLQQSFTRLCVQWLRTCASEDYHYDERNEASHEVAKKMLKDELEEKNTYCLPFI